MLTLKLIAEKTISSANVTTQILRMDMSKAFDTVRQNSLLEDLKRVPESDELHMVKVLLTEVKLAVKIDNSIGPHFNTNVGTAQFDSWNPILFSLYLARTLQPETPSSILPREMRDHTYAKDPQTPTPFTLLPRELEDYTYSKTQNIGMIIVLQYADDISWVAEDSPHLIDHIKVSVPDQLRKRNLILNEQKLRNTRLHTRGGDSGGKAVNT